ncbi:bifunctional riboflavin kinase/FMN adenylyltransferase [Paracoccus lichenicola]|uniref:bifunctional riboflavin kinase/FMN adenylyltransferase n=1 Tax=Paracoccus lichenicola TaxID=2665644 RepID=UPI0018A957B3|nr:bifunctional riboflavin kinase/FMN adenylyltransferase [Paracoccus lichenicola]
MAASSARLPHLHDDAAPLPARLRGSVMLLGNFDGLHRGHRALLARASLVAAAQGRPLSIMACEPHPRRFFAPGLAPFRLSCGGARYAALAEAGLSLIWTPRFDREFAALPPRDFIERFLVAGLAVAHVVVGEDFRFGAGRAGDTGLLRLQGRRWGFGVDVIKDVVRDGDRISSSLIRRSVEAGETARAVDLIGGSWRIPIFCAGLECYHVHDEQILPPPGTYEISASCRRGGNLGRHRIGIRADRHLTGALPASASSVVFG